MTAADPKSKTKEEGALKKREGAIQSSRQAAPGCLSLRTGRGRMKTP